MDLQREPDPKPVPPEATGAVVERKKIKVIVLAAVAVGLIIASFLTWLLRPRTVVEQRPMPAFPKAAVPKKTSPGLNESAEQAYEQHRRDDLRNNPAFNVGDNLSDGGRSTHQSTAEYRPAAQKRTPEDDYKDLLQKAALADSAVDGAKASAQITRPAPDQQPIANQPQQRQESKPAEHGLQPVSRTAIPAGTFIQCALVNELNGEMTGPVKVQVSNDVYNPDTFELLVPQGAVFLGEAQRVSSQFQGRLAVTFDRLQVTRNGRLYEIKLDKIPGLDQQGATALKDKVDNHYLQIFGVSLAIGAIGGLSQIGNGSYGGYQGYDTETQIRNGITQAMAQTATQVLNRFLNRLPTVIIRPGTPVIVFTPFGIQL
jgi:type IV secretory pathway VirB10-like protein